MIMNIWIVNKSSCENQCGESSYFNTEEKARTFMDNLKGDFIKDDTYCEEDNSFSNESYYVYIKKVEVQ